MKILVVGSGGREHALVWKLLQSPRAVKVFCAPGNAGIAALATCVAINADDVEGLLRFAKAEGVGLTVVGPEAALSLGIVDRFTSVGLRIFGPSGRAAELEGSKVFMKELLKKYGVPSGGFEVFTDAVSARRYIEQHGAPLVVKADGLAAGKGVIVAMTTGEALAAVDLIMADKAFGEAGNRVVVEEFLAGEEASFIAFTDGDTVLPLPTSQDHKAVYDGDKGPNTGGMGAYSPAPVVTTALHQRIMDEIMLPTVRAMAAEGRPYKGMLYAGLMIQGERLSVLEYNCRFGDPECQPLLMRLRTDLLDILEAVVDGHLATIDLAIDPRPAVCVVMAAGGYPGPYAKGQVILGLAAAAALPEVMVFHAGTTARNGEIVTNGGRVLGVTALGDSLQQAIDRAYGAVAKISWEGCCFRRDIGHKALRRQGGEVMVGIVVGSASDLPVMQGGIDFLQAMDIPFEVTLASAHRSPAKAANYASTARQRGIKIIIAAAGMAAHLAGVLAAHTTLPVVGVPIDASSLHGLDSLLATAQMPAGVPVATMAIGKAGAKNAAIFAAQILGVTDRALADKLTAFKQEMADQVEEKAAKLLAGC